jgi:predicted transcriptional regulator
MSVEEYRNHVKEGIEDYHSGRTTDHKDFENEIKSWK